MKRFFKSAIWLIPMLLGLLFLTFPAAGAEENGFSFQLNRQSASHEDIVELKVRISGSGSVAGFRVRTAYDDSVLRFVGTEASSAVEDGTLQTNGKSNPVYSVYVCNVDKGYAPKLSGTVLTYLFQVKDDASVGETEVGICVDEVCDYSEKDMKMDAMNTLSLNITPGLSANAYLTALEPSQGTLSPAFSPNQYDYSLSVDSTVRSVTFRADAVSGASVKVSRKTLNRAGSDTLIVVTVTSEDRKEQALYQITVSRAEKPQSNDNDSRECESKVEASSGSRASSKSSRRSGNHSRFSSEAAEKMLDSVKNKSKKRKSAQLSVSGEQKGDTSSHNQVPQGDTRSLSVTDGNKAQSASGLTIIQDRMPTYLVGMLAAGFCITVGIALCLWFTMKKK